jgi:selenide,water dikinase
LLSLPRLVNDNVLVDVDTCDDAGVYRIDDDRALVFTADFFPPVVPDSFTYGKIAVTNCVSDVYAMGATPFACLNLLAFPQAIVPPETISEILKGATEKMREAEIVCIGGHTMDDERINYGLAVLGWVHPDRIMTNANAKPGDALVLTKPIGSGIITTAMRGDDLVNDKLMRKISDVMEQLNKIPCERMLEHGAHACTDVTGFGLLGHMYEMVDGSNVTAEIEVSKIPYFQEAVKLCEIGILPGGSIKNRQFIQESVDVDASVPAPVADVLFDAQTSGGLLVALPEKNAQAYLDDIQGRGITDARIIGKLVERTDKHIFVKP